MAENHVVTVMIAARGYGRTNAEATAKMKRRIVLGADDVANDRLSDDPGIQTERIHPGDGPCAPFKKTEVLISNSGIQGDIPDDDD